MTTDDTSRDVLIESLRGSLANVLCNASNFPRKAMPYILGADMRPLIDKAAAAVVDAVVLPLVQERDAARAEALRVDEANTRVGRELTAARAELAAAEADRDTYRDRWRQLMRDYEAEFNRAEFNRAENERLRILWDASGKNDLIERAEAAEAAHKALAEAVRDLVVAWEDDARPVAGRIVTDLRAVLTEWEAAS